MPVLPRGTLAVAGALFSSAVPRALPAQGSTFGVSYGFWWADSGHVATFAAGLERGLFGPVGYSIGFTHVDDRRGALDDHTLSGAEVGLALGRDGSGLYAIGTVGAGFRHERNAVDALWSAGLGYAFRPVPAISMGIEARYRTEDRDFAGFWRLHPDDQRGLSLGAKLSFGIGGRRSGGEGGSRGGTPPPTTGLPRGATGTGAGSPPLEPPDGDAVHRLARENGASEASARTTATVVMTALDVMGTPYQWGGTDENGFDCSGLIQYAYGQAGILLPRVSRDQVRMGQRVDTRVAALRPGDLLGFSVEGTSRITHVGLYVGDAQFIHSASGGVKLTSLTGADGDSRWWRDRWVVARRIVD